jgi:hypothetical protein
MSPHGMWESARKLTWLVTRPMVWPCRLQEAVGKPVAMTEFGKRDTLSADNLRRREMFDTGVRPRTHRHTHTHIL